MLVYKLEIELGDFSLGHTEDASSIVSYTSILAEVVGWVAGPAQAILHDFLQIVVRHHTPIQSGQFCALYLGLVAFAWGS